jgi:hypothetical protein
MARLEILGSYYLCSSLTHSKFETNPRHRAPARRHRQRQVHRDAPGSGKVISLPPMSTACPRIRLTTAVMPNAPCPPADTPLPRCAADMAGNSGAFSLRRHHPRILSRNDLRRQHRPDCNGLIVGANVCW